MLRVTVELLPSGRESGKRVLATAVIARTGGVGPTPEQDYVIRITAEGGAQHAGAVKKYPRWSASIFDLVARAIVSALTGAERLPRRPRLLRIPVYEDGDTRYVKLSDIPEPARSAFESRLLGSTCPVIDGIADAAYAHDWQDFLAGRR